MRMQPADDVRQQPGRAQQGHPVREASGEGRVTDGDDVALFEVDGVEEGKVQPSRLPLRLIGNVLLAS